MELEKVTAEIRPRSQWEAIDLGLSLTRTHAGILLKSWLVSVIPACLLILALGWNALGWGVFLIWWLKPVWERVALHPLSRSLFGETPTLGQTAKVLPSELKANWKLLLMGIALSLLGYWIHREDSIGMVPLYWLVVVGLLFYRSNLYRSLVLPVRYLEGLNGAAYKSRAQVLSFRSSGAASGLTVVCLLMEIFVLFSQFYFINLMIPTGTDWNAYRLLEDYFSAGPDVLPRWVMAVGTLFYLSAFSLVTWFYVGGGFGLYVNSRTWTEGWDIELTFKRLGQRFGLLLFAFAMFSGTPSLKAEGKTIEQILADEAFDVQVREDRTWVPAEEEKKEEDEKVEESSNREPVNLNVFSSVGDLIFWVIVTAAVVGLVWFIVRNFEFFKGAPREIPEEEGQAIRTVAGMNITPESLPRDLLSVAQDLWSQGRHKEALGLLYRGAISSLVTRQVVDIEESDTEMDCLRRVIQKGELASPQYFELLTQAWMGEAYARQSPNEDVMQQLWGHWPFQERRSA